MISKEIKFEERYDDDMGQTTLYFIAPKEMLDRFFPKDTYPDAISMEISVETLTDNFEARHTYVCVSPTRKVDEAYEDYDWTDVDLPYEEIEELFILAGV